MTEKLPEKKQTVLGLYVTAKQAYEMWRKNPDKTRILDVRVPEEYIFVGHPEAAISIPIAFQAYKWDEKKGYFDIRVNPAFIELVQEWAGADEVILALCRSGGRSAIAANMLAQAGYSKVYNITDGMEGDYVEDEDNLFVGKRMKNGWKNSGAPWTYEVDPALTRYPADS